MLSQIIDDKYFKLVKPGLHVFLDFARKTAKNRPLSLPSLVEEVLDDYELIVQNPTIKGTYHYIQPNEAFVMRFLDGSAVYSADVQYLQQISGENMMLAKIRLTGPIRPGQTRSFFRLPYTTNVTLNFTYVAGSLKVNEGVSVDISCTGMLLVTNTKFEAGDKVPLEFKIGIVEYAEAEVLRVERLDKNAAFKYRVALQFLDQNPAQQERIYKHIMAKQLESRKSFLENKPLVTRGELARQ